MARPLLEPTCDENSIEPAELEIDADGDQKEWDNNPKGNRQERAFTVGVKPNVRMIAPTPQMSDHRTLIVPVLPVKDLPFAKQDVKQDGENEECPKDQLLLSVFHNDPLQS